MTSAPSEKKEVLHRNNNVIPVGRGPMVIYDIKYKFAMNNIVVIKHTLGQCLRRHFGDELAALGVPGDIGTSWSVILSDGGKKMQFKNMETGKFLRIVNDQIDVRGSGDEAWTHFKVHHVEDGFAKFESVKLPGKYLAVRPADAHPNARAFVGNGDKFAKMQVFRSGNTGPFTKVYAYSGGDNTQVVIMHMKDQYLRVNPTDLNLLDPKGVKGEFGFDEFVIWRVIVAKDAKLKVQFKSTKTGKFIRIVKNKVDVAGVGGPFTYFHVHDGVDFSYFESVKFPGQYLVVKPNSVVVGGEDEKTKTVLFRRNYS